MVEGKEAEVTQAAEVQYTEGGGEESRHGGPAVFFPQLPAWRSSFPSSIGQRSRACTLTTAQAQRESKLINQSVYQRHRLIGAASVWHPLYRRRTNLKISQRATSSGRKLVDPTPSSFPRHPLRAGCPYYSREAGLCVSAFLLLHF